MLQAVSFSFYTNTWFVNLVFFRKQRRLDRNERELPVMLVKRVLNQTLKPQRLKVRHQWLIRRQNLRRKKRNRKTLRASLKFPNKTLNLTTTANQISKCLMVRDLPFFCNFSYLFFLLVSSLVCISCSQVNQKRVHTLIPTDMDPSRRYWPVLNLQAFTFPQISELCKISDL